MKIHTKSILLLLVVMPFCLQLHGQTVNWASDIAPILYNHCVNCHRPDGIGGFSLVGYDNAYIFRNSIEYAVVEKNMPPWMADPEYRHFTGENTLSNAEIQKITQWVSEGGASGNLNDAPPDPNFPTGSLVGMPDEVLTTPVYTMTATADEYRCFVIPNGQSVDVYLRGLEVIPGNHNAVHHVLVYEDTSGTAAQLDQNTPEPGYVQFGGIGVNNPRLIGAWVPGSRTSLLPPTMGVKLTPGADLVVQVHFPASAYGLTEQTTLNLFFTPTNQGIRQVYTSPLINHSPLSLENFPLVLPANQVKVYHAKYKTTIPGSVITVAPHMHLIGKKVECFGVTSAGDTIPLIRINDWDFHWQGGYTFQQVQKIPAGTTLHAYVTYDNTTDNPDNPNNPPALVTSGEATTDEMLLVYFTFMSYLPGDENIILDSTLINTAVPLEPAEATSETITISPNPAQEWLDCQFTLAEPSPVRIAIINSAGQVVRMAEPLVTPYTEGAHQQRLSVAKLPTGHYFLQISTDKTQWIKPFTKQ